MRGPPAQKSWVCNGPGLLLLDIQPRSPGSRRRGSLAATYPYVSRSEGGWALNTIMVPAHRGLGSGDREWGAARRGSRRPVHTVRTGGLAAAGYADATRALARTARAPGTVPPGDRNDGRRRRQAAGATPLPAVQVWPSPGAADLRAVLPMTSQLAVHDSSVSGERQKAPRP
jgi:hypothetical protein